MGVERTIDITDAQRKVILALLKKHLPNTTAWVYGSRATWKARPQSDLDMVVFTTPAQERGVSHLRDAFEQSSLPFRVELFVWDAVPESFHGQIEAVHVVLAEKDDLTAGEQWRSCTWGELTTLEYGKALRDYRSAERRYPVFGTNGPIGWHTDMLDAGPGVIVGRKGAYRGVHYASGPFSVIDTAFYLKPKVPLNVRWAYYELLTHDINGLDSGSAIPSTSREDFYSLPVRVPPLPEQHAIAHILGTFDDKIELNRRMKETLESMVRALFQSWFVDFDPVHAKIALKRHTADPIPRRGNSTQATKPASSDHSPLEGEPVGGDPTPLPLPKGGDWTAERARAYLDRMEPEVVALFPDRFVASELGPIPAGWKVKPLGDLIELAYGKALKANQRQAGSIPVYGSNGRVGWHDRPSIPGPSIIVGRKGNPGTVTWAAGACFPIDTTFHVVPKDTPQSLPFLFYALKRQGLASVAADSAVPGLNRNLAYHNKQVTPPPPVVACFGEQVQSLFARRHSSEEESRTLASMRDTLLPKLISGEIRAPDAMKTENAAGFSMEFHDG